MPLTSVNTGDIITASQHNEAHNLFKTITAPEWITFTHKGADIVAAAALSLGSDGNYFDVTGTTGITSISSRQVGTMVVLRFDGIVTLTHNATTLALQGAANITTAAGDILLFISEGSGNWRQCGWTTIAGFVTLTGTQTLTNKTLTAPTIADFTNATHDHGDTDDGGAIVGGGDLYNFLTNPGFEVWQRGAGAFTADGAYTADRWLMDEVGTDTLSVTREGTTKSTNSLYSLAAVFVLGTGAGATQIYQQLSINANDENHQLLGQAISARIAVRTATASAVRTFIATDGTGGTTNYSGYHTGGSTFENLDVTNITVPSDATYVRVGCQFAQSSTVYMDNAALAISATAPTYKGLTRAEEWERCQRYYERHGGSVATSYIVQESAAAADTYGQTTVFATRKAVTPTMTKAGTWAVLNSGQPGADFADVMCYRASATASGAGAANFQTNGTDDYIEAEANP